MKNNLTLIIICWLLIGLTLLTSCSTQKCYPSKRSADYAVLLGDSVPDNWRKTTLISVKKTMKGTKHIFIAENGDTITRFYNTSLGLGCYILKQ